MSRDNVEALARLTRARVISAVAPWGETVGAERYCANTSGSARPAGSAPGSLCLLNEAPTMRRAGAGPAVVSSDVERAQVARIGYRGRGQPGCGPASFWLATQTLFDPEEDMDWRIVALVDVPASTRRNRVALATVTVGAR